MNHAYETIRMQMKQGRCFKLECKKLSWS